MIRPATPNEIPLLRGFSAWIVAEMDPWAGVRRAAFALYVAGFVVAVQWRGLPVDRESVILLVCGALLIGCLGRPWRSSLQIALDWLPVAAFLVVYDLSRGIADSLGAAIQFEPQLDAERWLFAGSVPTIWLQERFIDPERVQWWEVGVSLLYVSHFFVPFVLAGVLWSRNRERWLAWMRRFITLSFAGLATYIAFPAAPPWLADRAGLIPEVHRTASRGWWELDLGVAGDLIDKGQATSNAVAAVPSLHAAFALLAVAFLWRSCSTPWRIVLALYPLGMAFALVISAEHYVVDVLLGWAFVAAVMVACSRWERRQVDPHRANGGLRSIAWRPIHVGAESACPGTVPGVVPGTVPGVVPGVVPGGWRSRSSSRRSTTSSTCSSAGPSSRRSWSRARGGSAAGCSARSQCPRLELEPMTIPVLRWWRRRLVLRAWARGDLEFAGAIGWHSGLQRP